MIIAVDGPAASGKGTIARALARHYGMPHLDTGLLYRAVAATVLREALDPAIEADAVAACSFEDSLLDDAWLRTDEVGKTASVVSAHPLVRAALLQRQRKFAQQAGGAVLDGRDIGTVIAPDAQVKLFVKATPTIRAQRRHLELRKQGANVSLDKVLTDIRARDERDSQRLSAPMRQAEDAVVLDTSFLSIDAAIQRAIALVEERAKG
ncbi:(d)CMP kinase [Sphingomonas sp. LM7]|uniref:(d)CMP kinase n=1 Tax=Sphingomonas sp. LM7 TaxID=1938607 RepID=UPI0009838C96|nr:(d)CMP kinase [Sphingomonas sp. LM7]AQR76032.1 cytidylate kinase [Sphingomonas sp. LM7]